MQTRIEKLDTELRAVGLSDKELVAVHEWVEKTFPPRVYRTAVRFLGWVTVLLAAGAVALLAFDYASPEALWALVGAGIGGLAGIFAQKQ